jgi:hypothetical protein
VHSPFARRQFLRPDEVRWFLRLAVSPECRGAGRVPLTAFSDDEHRSQVTQASLRGHHGCACKARGYELLTPLISQVESFGSDARSDGIAARGAYHPAELVDLGISERCRCELR